MGGREDLPAVADDQGRTPAFRLLRRPAHRQRKAGHAPHPRAIVQRPLRSLQDHERLLRRKEGRLGHARPACRARGREAAAHLRQVRHRERDRSRALQQAVPGERLQVRRRVDRLQPADGVLARLRERVLDADLRLHPVGVVGAERDVEAGPRLQGLPRGAVLSPMREASSSGSGSRRIRKPRSSPGPPRPGRCQATSRSRSATTSTT